MTEANIVATIAAVCSVLVALFNYLKTNKVEKGVRTVYENTNGRFGYLLEENRRLRELVAAQTGQPDAIALVNEALENKDGRHHARDS